MCEQQRCRSAALLFAIAHLFSTKKRLTNLNGEQNDTWNLLVSHRICYFRAVQPFDLIIPRKQDLMFHATCLLLRRQFACNVKLLSTENFTQHA